MSNKKIKPLALIGECKQAFIHQGLCDNGFNVISLPADNRLAPQVSAHADMLLIAIDTTILCNEEYYEKNKAIFKEIQEYGYKINPSRFELSCEYPNDVALNQAIIGKNIIGRKDSCARDIIAYAEANGYNYHSIKQGYAKCSTLIINENAIISADAGIIALADRLGINALKINNGENEIALDGYNYGFIGGASASHDGKVFFFGDLKLHSQAEEIIKFCKDNQATPISLGKEKLYDIGGAIILPHLNEK